MKKLPSSIRTVCVFCGSSPGADPAFMEGAEQLGGHLADNGLQLVYGGGDKGLMGSVARAVSAGGGKVTGIIPEFLKNTEQQNGAADLEKVEMITVPDMHTRKQMMFERSDAFIALPGGIGTLEELVEIQTWAQLGRHAKPVALLNTNGFWEPYINLLEHMGSAGFLHNPEQAKPMVFEKAADIVQALIKT